MKVFVHVDAFGTYVGNGGFLTSCNLANRLAEMGYEASVFDCWNRLTWKIFKWLSLKQINFGIVNANEILKMNPEDYRIVCSWLQALPHSFRTKSLRVWDRSELLRANKEKERKWVLDNCDRIAVGHKHLLPYYNDIDIENPIILETWIRDDACYDRAKLPNTVGIQLERSHTKLSKVLSRLGITRYDSERYKQLKGYDLIVCNGSYVKVLENMKKADFYVHNPKPSPQLKIFRGETFGLPLFDAMACGCVCVAVEHEGIKLLRDTIPLRTRMLDVCMELDYLMGNETAKKWIRESGCDFVNKHFRFDDSRRKAIKQLLE